MLLFLQMDPTSSHDSLFRRFNLRGPPAFRLEMKQQKKQEEKIPIQAMATLKIIKKHHTQRHRPYDLPTWGQIKLKSTNQTEKLVSQQGMPRNPENIFLRYACFACFCFPRSG